MALAAHHVQNAAEAFHAMRLDLVGGSLRTGLGFGDTG